MIDLKPLLKINNSVYGCSNNLIVSRHPKGKLIHEIQVIYEDGTKLYFDTDSLKKEEHNARLHNQTDPKSVL